MEMRAARLNQHVADRTASWPRFCEFIRWEMAPYPGRMNTLIRITIAATLVMFVLVTFRIPNAALAGFYTILITRENLGTTWRQAWAAVLGSIAGTIYTLLGMMLFRGYPVTHFFWVIGTLFLIFFVMRTATNFGAALGFSLVISATLAIWDRPLSNEVQVADTLREMLIIAIGAGVTVATEAVYRIFDRSDPLLKSIDDLLLTVQQLVENLADRRSIPEDVGNRLLQYTTIGTGRLRLALLRQGVSAARHAQMTALLALAGRLIDLAAKLQRAGLGQREEDAARLRILAQKLQEIRIDLRVSGMIRKSPEFGGQPSASVPTLSQIERTVALMIEVFHGDDIGDDHLNKRKPLWQTRVLLPDAFQNREYLRFAFAGCLAAGVCYILYNALDWPGISTSIITCVVTALSTIGASHQRQLLRLAGYVAGGLIMGIPAQILILPYIDSVFQFALVFAAGTAIAAWFASASPRLSYFGLQMALPFYFINLSGFQAQTDLVVARDAVIGVLLGILAMGFIFDRFWAKSAADQMQDSMKQNLRMLAQLAAAAAECDRAKAMPQIWLLRSRIDDSFNGLTSHMDAVLFQFGAHREKDLSARELLRLTEPTLRSIYVGELELLEFRWRRGIGSELTPQQNEALTHFLDEYSDELMLIAALIAHEADAAPACMAANSIRLLRRAFEDHLSPTSQAITSICQEMVSSVLMLRPMVPDIQAKCQCDVGCAP